MFEDVSHHFISPAKIIFGMGTAKKVRDEVKRLGGEKVFVVTDPLLLKENVINPVIESLKKGGIPYAIYDGVEPDPPTELVDEATDAYTKEGCNLVVGIGGASSLDVAKGVSMTAANEGNCLDICGYERAKNKGVPKILLSTTHTAGGDLSPYVVLHRSKKDPRVKYLISEFAVPDVAIVDPLLTVSMPPGVTVDTGLDALTTAIEAYVSTKANPFSDLFAERAIELGTQYLPMAWARGSNLTARYYMCLTATYAGLAFVSSSVGSVHGLSYAIAQAYHLTHGRALGLLLPHVMRYSLAGHPEKYARVSTLMGKDIQGLSLIQAAALSVEATEEILDATTVSYRLREYGAKEEELSDLAKVSAKTAAAYPENPKDINEEDIFAIYQAAY
ncbi:MAG: iron-containing alcohol dehydrogenase [Deltaproteobacteria bacterium]|nr:iron-containing alcohol dehydrogenase [Deltaproteobacteria bacterium]